MINSAHEPGHRRGILRALEEAPGGGWSWAGLLLGWVLARNFLEGVIERPHQMGFDWRPDVSFPMFFLHFPLFYLCLFFFVTLWLHFLTGRGITRVARVVVLAYGLLLAVPLIDYFASRGRGYDLKYLLGLGSALWRLWNPAAALDAASPGQRIAVASAVILGGLYVFTARREGRAGRHEAGGMLRPMALGVSGMLGVYSAIAFLAAWPSLFARLTVSGAAGVDAAYVSAYQLRGLVAGESRRLALVMALPCLIGMPLFAWRAHPALFAALAKNLRWTRLAFYTGLAPVGAFLGYIVYRDFLPGAYGNPTDAAATVVLWGAFVAAYVASLCWNDLGDVEADRLNEPGRPLVTGALPAGRARAIASAGSLSALFLALAVGYPAFLLMIVCLFLSRLYSGPPVRLKRWPVAATFTLALLSLVSLASGFSLFAQEMTPLVFPRRLAGFMLVAVTMGFTAKDLKDSRGDRATGVTTLATLLTEGKARAVTCVLVAVSYLVAPLFLPLGRMFAVVVAAFAAAGAAAAWRVKKPDGTLLGITLVFLPVMIVFLAGSPRFLREQVPASFQEVHARVTAVEERIRLTRLLEEEGLSGMPGLAGGPGSAERAELLADVAGIWNLVRRTGDDGYNADIPGFRSEFWKERLTWARAQVAGPETALADLSELVARRPHYVTYREALLQGMARAERWQDAFAVCTEAIQIGLRPGDFLRNRAALAIAAGGRPVDDLAGAFLFGQRGPVLWVLRGDLSLAYGKLPEAIQAYRRATELDPAAADAWGALGEGLYVARDLGGALAAFGRAHELRPRDPWIINNLGVALRDAGRNDEALARFGEAHRIAPEFFEPLYNLGLTYEKLGDPAEARRWYAKARPLRPGFPPLEEAWERIGGGT